MHVCGGKHEKHGAGGLPINPRLLLTTKNCLTVGELVQRSFPSLGQVLTHRRGCQVGRDTIRDINVCGGGLHSGRGHREILWHRSSRLTSSECPSCPLDPSALRSQMFAPSLPLGAPDFLHMSSECAEHSGNSV